MLSGGRQLHGRGAPQLGPKQDALHRLSAHGILHAHHALHCGGILPPCDGPGIHHLPLQGKGSHAPKTLLLRAPLSLLTLLSPCSPTGEAFCLSAQDLACIRQFKLEGTGFYAPVVKILGHL